jgi:hypothetical protein
MSFFVLQGSPLAQMAYSSQDLFLISKSNQYQTPPVLVDLEQGQCHLKELHAHSDSRSGTSLLHLH